MDNLTFIIIQLKAAFCNDKVKHSVLKPEWLKKNIASKVHSTGFCYAASEVIYRLNGGKENWKKVSIAESKWEHCGHCYLVNKITNEILDITSDQYIEHNISIPYKLGKAGGFRALTKSAIKLSELAGLGDLKSD